MISISEVLQFLENNTKDFNFALIQDVICSKQTLFNSVKISNKFSLVKSFDGYISEVYEGNNPIDKSKSSRAFNFHSDGLYYKSIPEIIGLYCVRPGFGDNTTFLIDTKQAIEKLDQNTLSLLSKLEYTYIGRDGILHPRNLIETDPLSQLGYFITNMSAKGFISPILKNNIEMPELLEQQDAIYKFKTALMDSVVLDHSWKEGDLLLLNNNRYLHGRRESLNGPDSNRFLYRFWLQYDKTWHE